jgi:hypothetical protein
MPAIAAMAAKPETPETPATVNQKMTVNISRDVADRAKDAFWLARGQYRTFSAWVEDALLRHIEATKAAHGLDELPRRPGGGSLPPGRPLG